MARVRIREAHGGATREIHDVALPYFPGWVIIDTLDDSTDESPLYLSRAESDFRYVEHSEVAGVVAEALADDTTVAQAAANAVDGALNDVAIPHGEVLPADEFTVRFADGSPFIRANETQGIHDTQIAHLDNSVPIEAVQAFDTLADDQGWTFAFYTEDRHVVFGQRTDGSYYPDSLGGTRAKTPVVRWGDSLTANSATTGGDLGTLLGRAVYTQGVGGQTSLEVAARQGGVPTRVTVTGGIIPASGSVGVTLSVKLRSDTTGSYPLVIAGVAGQFTATDSTTYLVGTFTRDTPGLPAVAPPGSPAQTGYTYRDYWPIFWAGRNNFKQTDTAGRTDFPDQIVSDLRGMMAWTNQRAHALIRSIPPWVGEETGTSARTKLDQANAAIRDAFPAEFIDTAALLRNPAVITATGHTPTTQDLADIANGLTPTVFRLGSDGTTVDAGHLGPIGYAAQNMLDAQIYTSRGWNS